MILILTIECPHCRTVSEIVLSSNPRIIIFNCPECWAPQLYFDHKTYVLTDHQIEVLKNSSGPSSLGHMLKRMVQRKRHTSAVLRAHHGATNEAQSRPPHETMVSQQLDRNITADDITDLRIELAICRDSKEFIDNL